VKVEPSLRAFHNTSPTAYSQLPVFLLATALGLTKSTTFICYIHCVLLAGVRKPPPPPRLPASSSSFSHLANRTPVRQIPVKPSKTAVAAIPRSFGHLSPCPPDLPKLPPFDGDAAARAADHLAALNGTTSDGIGLTYHSPIDNTMICPLCHCYACEPSCPLHLSTMHRTSLYEYLVLHEPRGGRKAAAVKGGQIAEGLAAGAEQFGVGDPVRGGAGEGDAAVAGMG
jgi:hypothetical protein